ncbi:MAG: helix-turn-helix domain-containing protein [Tannerella sp.]|jgi:AraC-like DNA-binding protein|nr:helix-turn-helix domain-containing protein [Tannerella sp.]
MKKSICQLKGQDVIENLDCVYSIGEDVILMEKSVISMAFEHPFKIDMVHVIISVKGVIRGRINLLSYTAESPCVTVILAGQILEYEYVSDDFEGMTVIMSQRFTDSLNVEDAFGAFSAVRDNPVIPLTENAKEAMLNHYSMMYRTIKADDNPYRLEIARNLTRALFYGAGYYFYKNAVVRQKSGNEALVDRFMKLVQVHFKMHRRVEFYAEKLSLTPKYMSSVIRECSGKSAGEWIDERTVLEVKTLLKTTNMTIQQIADELNFPTQSYFGRYFKRLVGMSPKEYRKR